MQPNLTPFGNPFLLNGDLSGDGFQTPPASVLFLVPFLLFQGGSGMDLSKVGEKILSSVRSARSLGLLPPASDRPEFFGNKSCSIVRAEGNVTASLLSGVHVRRSCHENKLDY